MQLHLWVIEWVWFFCVEIRFPKSMPSIFNVQRFISGNWAQSLVHSSSYFHLLLLTHQSSSAMYVRMKLKCITNPFFRSAFFLGSKPRSGFAIIPNDFRLYAWQKIRMFAIKPHIFYIRIRSLFPQLGLTVGPPICKCHTYNMSTNTIGLCKNRYCSSRSVEVLYYVIKGQKAIT